METPQAIKFGKCWCCRQTGKLIPGPAVQVQNTEHEPMQVFTQVDLCDFCAQHVAQTLAIVAAGFCTVVPMLKPAKNAGILE